MIKSNFYPRSPCGERPITRFPSGVAESFLSTLSLRRATLLLFHHGGNRAISIHALLAESDQKKTAHRAGGKNFYPRSPCGERPKQKQHKGAYKIFLSTLSLRRATQEYRERMQSLGFLSTLSLRRATFVDDDFVVYPKGISIHALLAESDRKQPTGQEVAKIFLSTLSLRRATAKVHKTVGHFCAYETNFMEIASSC